MPDKYQLEYRYTLPSPPARHPRHIWSAVGTLGGLHLWIDDLGQEHEKKWPNRRYIGGLETHWRQPPEYMKDEKPSQEHCWLLNGPCWHDGGSLIVDELWIPRWEGINRDNDKMLAFLAVEAAERFEQNDESEFTPPPESLTGDP